MNRLKLLGIFSFIVLFVLTAQPVLAHANLVRSEPPANSAQQVAPKVVRVWFSENVEPSFTSISVLDTTGTPVDKADSHLIVGDPKAMEVSLPDLPLGLYTVRWKALSADDGHTSSGSFSFTVGDVPLSESSPREIMALVDTALSASAPPPAYDVLTRWLNLVSLVLLLGNFAFPLLILLPSIRIARTQSPALPAEHINSARAAWTRRWLRLLLVSFSLYLMATIGVLLSQSLTAGGLQSISRVVMTTRFGTLWLLRAGTLIALGVLIFKSWSPWKNDLKADRTLLAATMLSAVLLITQSLNSHGAAVSDPPYLALVIDFIHLLGTAIWVGGLFQLVITLPAFVKSFEPKQRAQALAIVVARFSFVVFLTVNIIILSGVYSLIVQVGSFEALWATLYGQSLMAKIVLIGVVLVIAAFNLIVVRPSLAQAKLARAITFTRQFRWATTLEAIGGIAILLIVGLLTSVPPARVAYDPAPKLVMQTQQVDDLVITLGVAPGLVGANDFDVKVRDASGRPVSNASVVRILGTMLDMEMGTQETTTTPQGDGHYTLHADLLSMMGRWNLEVLVRREGRDDARPTFALVALDKRSQTQTFSLDWVLAQPNALLGLGLAMLGFVVGTASVLIGHLQRRTRLVTLFGAVGVSILGVLVVFQTPAYTQPATTAIAPVPFAPEFARFMRSPIPSDATNLTAGRQIYQQYCAVCHGPEGKGNGPLATSLNPRPVDLTVHAPLHPEGVIFYWVTNGIPGTAMPKWEPQLSDLQRWQVVLFIRALGPQTPTPVRTTSP